MDYLDTDIIAKAMKFAESKEWKETGELLRSAYAVEIFNSLGKRGTIPYGVIMDESVLYTKRMQAEFKNKTGEMNLMLKGAISYEVADAINKIYPSSNKVKVYIELFRRSVSEI